MSSWTTLCDEVSCCGGSFYFEFRRVILNRTVSLIVKYGLNDIVFLFNPIGLFDPVW
jgi:hypothetical protein